MSRYTFIINSFGLRAIKPLVYRPGSPLEVTNYQFPSVDVPDLEKFDTLPEGIQKTSLFGTPVFSDVVLEYGDLHLELDAVICEVTQRKNIVSAKIVGRNGTVKEYINDDDYSLNIKGILFNTLPDKVPSEQIEMLNNILKINDSIKVVSPYLDLFDIKQIVIQNCKYNQLQGKLNIVNFELIALSDLDLSIIVNE